MAVFVWNCADVSGLCMNAGRRRPRFAVNELTMCQLRLNYHSFTDCAALRSLSLSPIEWSWVHRCTYIHPFNGPLSGTARVSWYQKGKSIWILLKLEAVSGRGISWAMCKSAPRSRQITMPAPHHLFFTGQMPFLPVNQRCQSTDGTP